MVGQHYWPWLVVVAGHGGAIGVSAAVDWFGLWFIPVVWSPVVLAVLVGTVDGEAWRAISQARLVGRLVVGPMMVSSLVVSLVAWVYVGCLVHAFGPQDKKWDWLSETAGVVTLTAAGILPVGLGWVVYQMWRLLDVGIAATGGGA